MAQKGIGRVEDLVLGWLRLIRGQRPSEPVCSRGESMPWYHISDDYPARVRLLVIAVLRA